MNPFETTVALDPSLSVSVLNVSTTGKKGGQSDGIPIPLSLQPAGSQNQVLISYTHPTWGYFHILAWSLRSRKL